jgi:hypothetical protein
MANLWPTLAHWLTDDKAGLTLATWCLVMATFMLVATGLGAIGFAGWQLRAERNQRRIENLNTILDEFNGEILRSHRARYAAARMNDQGLASKDDVVFPDGAFDVLDFCERVAFLTRNGHLDDVQVWSVFGNWIGAYNQDLVPNISTLRPKQKTAYEDFTWLVKRLGKIDTRKGGCFFTLYEKEDLSNVSTHTSWLTEITTPAEVQRKRLASRGTLETMTEAEDNKLTMDVNSSLSLVQSQHSLQGVKSAFFTATTYTSEAPASPRNAGSPCETQWNIRERSRRKSQIAIS